MIIVKKIALFVATCVVSCVQMIALAINLYLRAMKPCPPQLVALIIWGGPLFGIMAWGMIAAIAIQHFGAMPPLFDLMNPSRLVLFLTMSYVVELIVICPIVGQISKATTGIDNRWQFLKEV